MKIYARQVEPQYSGYFLDDYLEDYTNITVFGNNDYSGKQTEIFSQVYKALDSGDLLYEIDKVVSGNGNYNNITEAINDYLPRVDGKNYSCKDIHNLRELVEEYASCRRSEESRIICAVLSIVTRKDYDYREIHGCCQGEWNVVYYPTDEYSIADIREFETYYFNTGSEWIIHDGTDEPKTAEEISGYSYYCTSYDERKEIAEAEGVSPDDVILYEYHESVHSYYTAV